MSYFPYLLRHIHVIPPKRIIRLPRWIYFHLFGLRFSPRMESSHWDVWWIALSRSARLWCALWYVLTYLPAIAIVSATERQLFKRQPYHRCFGLRVNIPIAASFWVRFKIEIRTDGIFSAFEVVAILCKVATTHCQNKENNLWSIPTKRTGQVSLY